MTNHDTSLCSLLGPSVSNFVEFQTKGACQLGWKWLSEDGCVPQHQYVLGENYRQSLSRSFCLIKSSFNSCSQQRGNTRSWGCAPSPLMKQDCGGQGDSQRCRNPAPLSCPVRQLGVLPGFCTSTDWREGSCRSWGRWRSPVNINTYIAYWVWWWRDRSCWLWSVQTVET